MDKIAKDIKDMQQLVMEKENKEQLTETDAEELLEALRLSLIMNRAMIKSIIGGNDK